MKPGVIRQFQTVI